MSCYNFQYTGMPEYSGRDSSMDMSGWQNWQRGMDNGMGNHVMNGSMGSGTMNRGMGGNAMNRGMNSDRGMDGGNMRMPGWTDWWPEQNPAPTPAPTPAPAPAAPQETFCLDSGVLPLAMSYVPMQRWTQPLPIDRAMERGTIFQELDLPFMMGRCR